MDNEFDQVIVVMQRYPKTDWPVKVFRADEDIQAYQYIQERKAIDDSLNFFTLQINSFQYE